MFISCLYPTAELRYILPVASIHAGDGDLACTNSSGFASLWVYVKGSCRLCAKFIIGNTLNSLLFIFYLCLMGAVKVSRIIALDCAV